METSIFSDGDKYLLLDHDMYVRPKNKICLVCRARPQLACRGRAPGRCDEGAYIPNPQVCFDRMSGVPRPWLAKVADTAIRQGWGPKGSGICEADRMDFTPGRAQGRILPEIITGKALARLAHTPASTNHSPNPAHR